MFGHQYNYLDTDGNDANSFFFAIRFMYCAVIGDGERLQDVYSKLPDRTSIVTADEIIDLLDFNNHIIPR